MQFVKFWKKIGQLLIHFAKFLLRQIGYRFPENRSKQKRISTLIPLFIFTAIAFIISLRSANDTAFMSILGSLVATCLVLVPLYWEHKNAIKKYREDSIPVADVQVGRTPHGSLFGIYCFLYAYSFVALIYRYFAGELALWLINYAVYFTELISTIIGILVTVLGAELIID